MVKDSSGRLVFCKPEDQINGRGRNGKQESPQIHCVAKKEVDGGTETGYVTKIQKTRKPVYPLLPE